MTKEQSMMPNPSGTMLSHHRTARTFWDAASAASDKASILISIIMHPWQSLVAVKTMVNVHNRVTQDGVQSWWRLNDCGGGGEGMLTWVTADPM